MALNDEQQELSRQLIKQLTKENIILRVEVEELKEDIKMWEYYFEERN